MVRLVWEWLKEILEGLTLLMTAAPELYGQRRDAR